MPHQVPGLVVYRYDSPLFFANAEDFTKRALAVVDQASARERVEWFVLNAEANIEVDLTAVDALESLRGTLDRRGIVFAMARVKQDLRHVARGRRLRRARSARTSSSRPCRRPSPRMPRGTSASTAPVRPGCASLPCRSSPSRRPSLTGMHLDQLPPTVVAIHVAKGRRLPTRSVPSVEAEAGAGLVGDRYHGSRHRHVTIQSLPDLEAAAADLGRPVDPG